MHCYCNRTPGTSKEIEYNGEDGAFVELTIDVDDVTDIVKGKCLALITE